MADNGGCFGCVGRVGCVAVLVAAGFGVWYFRAPIGDRLFAWWRDTAPALPSTELPNVGAPTEGAVTSLAAKRDQLESSVVDSVELTPNEVAALIGSGLDWTIRRAFDSLRVELADDRIVVHTRYDTAHLPDEALGVLDGVLQDREPLVMGGRLFAEDRGRLRWLIDEVRIRRVPVPRSAIAAVVGRIAQMGGGEGLVVRGPEPVAFVRVSPSGVTLKRLGTN